MILAPLQLVGIDKNTVSIENVTCEEDYGHGLRCQHSQTMERVKISRNFE